MEEEEPDVYYTESSAAFAQYSTPPHGMPIDRLRPALIQVLTRGVTEAEAHDLHAQLSFSAATESGYIVFDDFLRIVHMAQEPNGM